MKAVIRRLHRLEERLVPQARLSYSETLRLALRLKRDRQTEERARQAAISQGGHDDPQRNSPR
jgi:hypothetical protein